MILSTSGTKARKSLNQYFWNRFCRLLEPWPESHQIETSGNAFVDFWSQGQKVIKSGLLNIISSVSGINARKTWFYEIKPMIHENWPESSKKQFFQWLELSGSVLQSLWKIGFIGFFGFFMSQTFKTSVFLIVSYAFCFKTLENIGFPYVFGDF